VSGSWRASWARLRVWLCAALLCCATLRTAQADDRAERTARAHFKRGERAFNLGKFKEAERAYAAAYQAQPLPAFLFNLAQCHRNLGNPERALFFFRRYLTLEPDGPNRKMVLDLIDEQEGRLAERNASAERDAKVEAKADAEPLAPPNTQAEGDAPPGEGGAVPPDLHPRAPAEEAPPASLALAPPAPAPPLYRRWWVWAAGGVVVAGVAAALLIKREGSLPTGQLGGADLR
jgi:tetratricopeptide (TPR) repeat protein